MRYRRRWPAHSCRCSEAGVLPPAEACTIDIESSTVTDCGPVAWTSTSVRPRHGSISASRPWMRWLRLSLVETWAVRARLRKAGCVCRCRGWRRRCCRPCRKHLHFARDHRLERGHHIVARRAGRVEAEATAKPVEKLLGRFLGDANECGRPGHWNGRVPGRCLRLHLPIFPRSRHRLASCWTLRAPRRCWVIPMP